MTLVQVIAELIDLAGQLIRRDHGKRTLRNVIAQARAVFAPPEA